MATHERAVWGRPRGKSTSSASRTSIPTEMAKSAAKKRRLSVCSIGSTAMEMASLTKTKRKPPRSGCATGRAKGPSRRTVSPDHRGQWKPDAEPGCCGSNGILLDSQFARVRTPSGWPHGRAEIGRLHRTSGAIADPHGLASWVNEIPGYRTEPSSRHAKLVALSFQSGSPTRQARGGPGVAESERVAVNLAHPRGKLVGVLVRKDRNVS